MKNLEVVQILPEIKGNEPGYFKARYQYIYVIKGLDIKKLYGAKIDIVKGQKKIQITMPPVYKCGGAAYKRVQEIIDGVKNGTYKN